MRSPQDLSKIVCRVFSVHMAVTLPLSKMSREEKLKAMEALWEDLSAEDDRLESPLWHGDGLREAEHLVSIGKAKFSDWKEAKKRIRRKAAKNS